MRRQPHSYADDLINYLRVTFMNLATLPASIREAVHFTCMTHVCNAILDQVTGPNVSALSVTRGSPTSYSIVSPTIIDLMLLVSPTLRQMVAPLGRGAHGEFY